MGYWKPDENPVYVCPECFDDQGLKDFIEGEVEAETCTFCDNESDAPIAAPMEEVLEHIDECLRREYDMAEECLPYETAEGGYIGKTWTTYDLLLEECLPNDESDELLTALCDGLEDRVWCEKNPFSLTDAERLIFSWDAFCHLVKHRLRFFFLSEKRDPDDDELYSPLLLLKELARWCEQFDLIQLLPAGSLLYRARRQKCGEILTTAGDLGPPPQERATMSNRMSPPGIVMFYVSDNPDTALRETVQCPDTFAIGKFRTRREAKILDLTDVPPIPSLFASIPETSEYDPRQPAIFLNHFAAELSKPIARDDRSHIEYIPPQIITEYFRIYRLLDGIRYRSARHAGHCSLVLFATQDDLISKKENRVTAFTASHNPWIELTGHWQREVTKDEFEQWNREWQQNEQHEREWSQEDQWL